ncbi:glycosyl transferase [Lutibacter profundi]|uniref:Glycosyl transferase n=1 Tax=Lutibacter profundi TaxID=1622118 RepID=A0A109RMY7_9FLAO|nr:glycosyltransferase family 2 protein [Lutibacter profundi]AMC10135.1 glycosyl transferase [Lutibacter profundi]
MSKLVSIITPNYNCEKYIATTIESVINQTYKNWELIIVDDCSTDNSVKIINDFINKDKRIKLIKLSKNSGPAVARNKAIEVSKGSYMAFLDSDDLWFPKFLESSIKVIQNTEGFVFASYHRYDENLNPYLRDFKVPKRVNYYDILKSNSISCLTAFIDIDKLGKRQMPQILYRQDMGLWLFYLKKIKYAVGIQKPLAIYRIRKKSHSRNKINLLIHQWYFYRNVEHLSTFNSIYYFALWSFYGFKKYIL